MPDLWYCSLKSGVWGPAPKSEVEKILKDGYLNKKTWVRKKEDADWMEDAGLFALEEIPEPKPGGKERVFRRKDFDTSTALAKRKTNPKETEDARPR